MASRNVWPLTPGLLDPPSLGAQVEMNGVPVAKGAAELDVAAQLQALPRPVVLGFSRRGCDFPTAAQKGELTD